MISKFVVPPGGWQYTEYGFILTANTFDELVTVVKFHRKNNDKEVGDVEKDVMKQLYEAHPSIRIEPFKVIISK